MIFHKKAALDEPASAKISTPGIKPVVGFGHELVSYSSLPRRHQKIEASASHALRKATACAHRGSSDSPVGAPLLSCAHNPHIISPAAGVTFRRHTSEQKGGQSRQVSPGGTVTPDENPCSVTRGLSPLSFPVPSSVLLAGTSHALLEFSPPVYHPCRC